MLIITIECYGLYLCTRHFRDTELFKLRITVLHGIRHASVR